MTPNHLLSVHFSNASTKLNCKRRTMGKSSSSRACLKQVILSHTQSHEQQQDNDYSQDQTLILKHSYFRLNYHDNCCSTNKLVGCKSLVRLLPLVRFYCPCCFCFLQRSNPTTTTPPSNPYSSELFKYLAGTSYSCSTSSMISINPLPLRQHHSCILSVLINPLPPFI